MNKKLIFIFFILISHIGKAGETSSLILRGVVQPRISLKLDNSTYENRRSVFSLLASSNTYSFSDGHEVEIENPQGLDLKTEVIELPGKNHQKEYRISVGNNLKFKDQNPYFTVKISAN